MDAQPPAALKPTAAARQSNVPWHPLLAIGLIVFVYFAAQIIGGIGLSIYPALQHWTSQQANDWLNSSIVAQFWFTIIFEALTAGAIYLFVKAYKKTLAIIGWRRPQWRDIGFGLLAFAVYFVIFAIVVGLASHYIPSLNVDQKQDIGFNDVHGQTALILTFFSLVILPPIVEELTFRGLIFTSLRKSFNFYWAALATSLLFALPHLAEGGGKGPLYIGGIDTLTLSLVLCYVREKTDRIWAGVLVHMLKNFVAYYSLYILGGK